MPVITISKRVEYSLALISYLARNEGESVSLKQAALTIKLPYRFLAQLALSLKQGNILESKEGRSGGYQLASGWDKVNLYRVLEVLGETDHLVDCLGDGYCPKAGSCTTKGIWQKIEHGFIAELKKISLKEL